jgi:uncharacterized protein YdaU (DUF1376 family)
MTELELQRAKRCYAQMVRPSRWERFRTWLRSFSPQQKKLAKRRVQLDRKAEVERKARQSL